MVINLEFCIPQNYKSQVYEQSKIIFRHVKSQKCLSYAKFLSKLFEDVP